MYKNIFLYYLNILNKKVYIYVYLFMYKQKKQSNKYSINSKNDEKNIFMFLICWKKINEPIKKKQKSKILKMNEMGSGGAKQKSWCE